MFLRQFAEELARELALPILQDSAGIPSASPASRETFALRFVDDVLELQGDPRGEIPERGPARVRVSVDFSREHRHSRGTGKQQPLFRAVGPRPRTVFDATLGFARDAYHLACSGYHVSGCEREPAIVALLRDGVRRAQLLPSPRKEVFEDLLQFRAGDAAEVLACTPPPDTVYVDPMFPPNPRDKALPKKEIQCLRALVGPAGADELQSLIEAARVAATDRVVVKRPHWVRPLPGARHRVKTKLVCYDVFAAQ